MSDFTLEHVSSYEPVVAVAAAFPHLISPGIWVNEFEDELCVSSLKYPDIVPIIGPSAVIQPVAEIIMQAYRVTGQYESLESISAIDIRYGELHDDGVVDSAVIQPVAEIIDYFDLYNPPDVIFAGHIKGFSGRSTNVQQISYMRMLPEEPLNSQGFFGKDEYTYVGIFGNSQMITQTVSGSIRPGSGFVYPRKI